MECIDMEIWEPTPENPRMVKYVGQRTAKEVFDELTHRLDSIGYLPDEYFLMDRHWENGKEIPKDADILCMTDYGASEGIYLEIYLKWYDTQQEKSVTANFATGKTLGETELDLDRMNLIASSVTKAFHSDGVHARYIRFGEPNQSDGCVMHLNGAERRLLIDSLVDKQDRLTDETLAVEQLLRRMTGSITEYVNEMGQRPMALDDFDMAVLAIQDGSMAAFNEVYKKIPEKTGELLVCAAGRPGNVGKKMTILLLEKAKGIPNDIYLQACKKAVDTGDAHRVFIMAAQAGECRIENDLSVYGDIVSHAISAKRPDIAREILNQYTPQMVEAANPHILVQALNRQYYDVAFKLVEKGIIANHLAAEIIHTLSHKANDRIYFNLLLDRGMKVDNVNYSAMQACIKTNSPEQAKRLLDNGMDFALYTEWAESNNAVKDGGIYDEVKAYWENTIMQKDS